MSANQSVAAALQAAPKTNRQISRSLFEAQGENTADEDSEIATFVAERPRQLRGDRDVRITIPAYESFTTDGTGSNTETFTLSNDIVQSPVSQNIVLWDDGDVVSPDSVDYGANSFDYTDSATGSELDVYYLVSDPAEVVLRKRAPTRSARVEQRIFEENATILNQRDQDDDGFVLTTDDSPFQGTLPEDYELALVVNAAYTVRLDGPSRTNGSPSALNLLLQLPAQFINTSIPGVDDAVKRDIAGV
jgi:hypothetical protein